MNISCEYIRRLDADQQKVLFTYQEKFVACWPKNALNEYYRFEKTRYFSMSHETLTGLKKIFAGMNLGDYKIQALGEVTIGYLRTQTDCPIPYAWAEAIGYFAAPWLLTNHPMYVRNIVAFQKRSEKSVKLFSEKKIQDMQARIQTVTV